MSWFEKHRELLEKAIDVCEKRYSWTAYPESPSSKIHGTEPPIQGKKNFESMLNNDFQLKQTAEVGRVGAEVSPYTRQPLGVSYPLVDVEALYQGIEQAMPAWRDTDVETRVGVCLEILDRCSQQLFENAHATMHTSGQSYIMAFAGSGANALDRGLEALVYAYQAIKQVTPEAQWQRRFGKTDAVTLNKQFKLMPVGVSVAVCCATFPLWNGYPALIASLVTGNPVVMKPHPSAILPVAMVVRVCQQVLKEAGFDPNLVTMVADTREEPLTMPLLEHPSTAIIDFTGSPKFGSWIEQNCRNAQVYTETAGCNSVVLESCDDLDKTAMAIAHSLCQASAQMCTSVQNIHVPASGVMVGQQQVSFEQVAQAIVDAVEKHLADAKNAAFLCGTLVNDEIFTTIDRMREAGKVYGNILRDSAPYQHPEFDNARTATPLIIQLDRKQSELYREELFGPVAFIIKGEDRDACLHQATKDAKECGAITSHVYSTDDIFLERALDAYNNAGASVAANLVDMPINFAAAYSDYHVTGLNPAGNACLTDLAFVCRRFRIVQRKVMA